MTPHQGRCSCMEVTANEIPSRGGWGCQRASLGLVNIFANDLEKEGEMHSIYFIWFSRKEARLSPAPGRPLISKHCYPTVCRDGLLRGCAGDCLSNAQWWRWWQQYKRICSNYPPGEGAAQEQSSSWRKQNAVKQINKSLCGEGVCVCVCSVCSINLQGFLLQIILIMCGVSMGNSYLLLPLSVGSFTLQKYE